MGGYPQAGLGYGALGEYLSLPALVLTLLIGGMLIGFGARWAGACPGNASTTLGGGSVMGIVLVVGIIAGIALRDAVFARQAVQTSEPLPNVSNS